MKPHAYATGVMTVLSRHLRGVWSEWERDSILRSLMDHHQANGTRLEVIVDDPFRANWRLHAAAPGRVRLASHHLSEAQREAAHPTELAVNAELDAL